MTNLSILSNDDTAPAMQSLNSDRPRLVMTSVRLDPGLHQALRQIAFDRRISLHSLLIEGARAVQQRYANSDLE